MNSKETYENLDMSIIVFDDVDIITGSNDLPDGEASD